MTDGTKHGSRPTQKRTISRGSPEWAPVQDGIQLVSPVPMWKKGKGGFLAIAPGDEGNKGRECEGEAERSCGPGGGVEGITFIHGDEPESVSSLT